MIALKKTARGLLLVAMLLIFPATGAMANMYFHDSSTDGSLEYFIAQNDDQAQLYTGDYSDLDIKTAVFLGYATSNYDTFTRDDSEDSPFFATGDVSDFGAMFSYDNGDTPADSFFSRYDKTTGEIRDSSPLGSDRTQAWQLSQDFTITYGDRTITLKAGDIVVGYEDWGDYDYNDMVVLLTPRESSAVPIPGAVWLLGSGLLGLVVVVRRRKML